MNWILIWLSYLVLCARRDHRTDVLLKMYYLIFWIIFLTASELCTAQTIHVEDDVNLRVEPGARTCFFEKATAGQTMEVYYQVLDGQHGDLDISFDVIDPSGEKLVSDYKKSENSIIIDLVLTGDYFVCLDNTYSVMNSKLVFVYVLIEDKNVESEASVSVVDADGTDHPEEEVIEWMGTDASGETYYIEVKQIAESLSRTLKQVVRARHMLDMYAATKSRDAYLAFEDTFIVDVWSGFQISVMFIVGMVQVYVIKKLFNRP